MKFSNKKCVKEEVSHLVQESVESKFMREIFEELLDALVESNSVKIKLLGTRTCLALTKLDQCSNSHETGNKTLGTMQMKN